ncbi:PREDICTED: cyclic AMP-responsive element-binding protein 3-like protein 2 [Amphimedon queenslandica]|uniref:BZIP domain-containing protein n=1 Tax=Amphimedon queenslandica TaxID=400682 RepID=A0A1X7UPY4_AMPQE|nr:PREDICTED: cyclic AMP-responsive element-binding protein 3-like protein 2 [Amphimedon queenslandica]|eukprot:XP_003387078.1 PREDICTED: cyclic AMP-responsive element-binding protein 3-like protein 2 [Amphimedon queenslandica]
MEAGTENGGTLLPGNDEELDGLLSYLLGDETLFYGLNDLASPLPLHWDSMDLPTTDNTQTQELEWNQTTQELERNETTEELERNEVISNVLHDHSYCKKEGTGQGAESPADLLMKADNEESSSDGGYDTMSSSPGSKLSPHASPSNKEETPFSIDPVKLIDERIKYFMSKHDEVNLTEEEKQTLTSEGLPIPTTLPLTKTEEKALKTVRRKIRNKVAAQESRNKRKKYMETLEERLKSCSSDNKRLLKKVSSLETENKSLRQQLVQLQALVTRATNQRELRGQFGSCLLVIVLCFGILFANLLPYTKVSLSSDISTTAATVRSRSLLSVESAQYSWAHCFLLFCKHLLPRQLPPPVKSATVSKANSNYLFNTNSTSS